MNVTLPSQKLKQFPLRFLLEKSTSLPALPSLTICRDFGTLQPGFGDNLAAYINLSFPDDKNQIPWTVFDRSKLADTLAWLAYRSNSSEILNQPTVQSRMIKLIQSLCEIGHVIILDRAGYCSTVTMEQVTHIKIEGEKAKCIQRLQGEFLLSKKEAELFLKTSEISERKYEASFPESLNVDFDYRLNSDRQTESQLFQSIKDLIN